MIVISTVRCDPVISVVLVHCSVEVKSQLFSAYCSSMYCAALWCNFKKYTIRKLTVAYNNIFRRLMFLPKWCSASGMFVHSAVNSFGELWRKLALSFRKRVVNSKNSSVEDTYNSTVRFVLLFIIN